MQDTIIIETSTTEITVTIRNKDKTIVIRGKALSDVVFILKALGYASTNG